MEPRQRKVPAGAVMVVALSGVLVSPRVPAAPAVLAAPAAPAPSAPPRAPARPAAASLPAARVPALRPVTPWKSSTNLSEARLAELRESKLEVVRELFAAAEVAFPPAEMLLRAFKQDRRLELWGASRAGSCSRT